mmetsp:Transcript_18893/g.29015  ORF Transcript_18893/g.29015 Transcript_18893/m.29015 type:complete len:251 (+) Transcript_18893:3365-4117(+)
MNFESRAELHEEGFDVNRASLGAMIFGKAPQQFSEIPPHIHKEKSEVVKPTLNLLFSKPLSENREPILDKPTSPPRLQRQGSILNDLDELQSLFSRRKGKGLKRKGAKSLNPSPVVLSKLTSSAKPKSVAVNKSSHSRISENRRINAEQLSSLGPRPSSPKSFKSINREGTQNYTSTTFANLTTKARGKGPLIEFEGDKRHSHQDQCDVNLLKVNVPNIEASKGQLSPTSPMSVMDIPLRGRELNQSILA